MKIAVIGAGLAGLTAAWVLHKEHEVTLFEKKTRAGGWIETIQKEGFLLELGPRGFRPHEKTLWLCRELDLKPIEASPTAHIRYLWQGGKMKKVSPALLLKHLPALLRELTVKPSEQEESIGAFFERRMGKRVTQEIIDPLVTGIFGGDLRELSMEASWPRLKGWEREYGSLVRAFFAQKREKGSALLSFEGGMESMIHRLLERMEGKISLHLNTPVDKKDLAGFDHVWKATPPSVPHLSLTTVHLGWRSSILPLQGFGYLIPSSEKERILGMTFDSQMFPTHPGQTRLCVMIRGEVEGALEMALEALKRHLGVIQPPDVIHLNWAHQALPQYKVGHPFPSRELGGRIGVNQVIQGVLEELSSFR